MTPIQLVDAMRNPDVGILAPDGFLEQHYKMGGTWSGNTELTVSMTLYALALANRATTIVETGVNNGAGATLWLVLAAMATGGQYHGIDIDPESTNKAGKACAMVLPRAAPTFYRGNALDVIPATFKPGTIDFLFVDDDHHRAQVEREVAAFLPLMRVGGLMCFHDIVGVHAADIWPVIEPLGAVRMVDVEHTPGRPFGGLGVLKVKAP